MIIRSDEPVSIAETRCSPTIVLPLLEAMLAFEPTRTLEPETLLRSCGTLFELAISGPVVTHLFWSTF
jgi:hypothetical protein